MQLLRTVGAWVAMSTMIVVGVGALSSEEAAWQRLDRPPFQFVFREESRPEAESLAAEAPRVLADLVRDLGVHPPPVISVTILPVSGAARSAGEGGGAPHWAVGFVRGSSSAVVLRGDLIRAEPFSFINFLEREHGPGAVRRVMIGMTIGEPFPEAFRRAVGIELGAAEAAWRDKVTWAYRWIPALTSTGVLWFVITCLVFLSRIAKRRRERALQEAWEREGLG